MDADNNPGHQGQSTREGEKGRTERPADTQIHHPVEDVKEPASSEATSDEGR